MLALYGEGSYKNKVFLLNNKVP